MSFTNCYEDTARAESYAKLEFPGTYYLAFRDLPTIISNHAKGNVAMDFGCGAGRSTRFTKNLGFEIIGVDISTEMITAAKRIDPIGDYRIVKEGILDHFEDNSFDLIQSIFTFDNVPTEKLKIQLFSEFRRILKKDGIMINLVSSQELYVNDWASFTTTCFANNFKAKCGDRVYTIMKDVEDQRPVEDELWPDINYKRVYSKAGLALIETYKPLGYEYEPIEWVNETRIAPWSIYVLTKK